MGERRPIAPPRTRPGNVVGVPLDRLHARAAILVNRRKSGPQTGPVYRHRASHICANQCRRTVAPANWTRDTEMFRLRCQGQRAHVIQDFMVISLTDRYVLEPWQRDAVRSWMESEDASYGRYHGIFDVYTGAGKTVLGVACMAAASNVHTALKYAIVVPTEALAFQWLSVLPNMTRVAARRIGLVGAKHNDNFSDHDIVIYVLASARRIADGVSRLGRDVGSFDVLLIVDECHKSGAKGSKAIFDAKTWGRLGLSATPVRADLVDRFGCVLPLSKQPHGMAIGPVRAHRS